MEDVLTALPAQTDTIAELRALYRAAEARSARLRLLSSVGRELALSGSDTIDDTLQRCARDLAFFLGSATGRIERDGDGPGLAIRAPGSGAEPIAWLAIDGRSSLDAITDHEDRETCRMCLDLFGATIDRLARDSERAELFAALADREHRLEGLVSQLFTAQEEERRRVSHDLHDGVAQTATALARMLEGGGSSAAKGLDPAARAQLANIARDLLSELRAVIGGLRPTLLDDLGLAAALQALGDGLAADGYRVTTRIDPDAARLAPHVETALFRVAQEAVANIRKHAGGPCGVMIELRLDGTHDRFLRICDTGAGIVPALRPAIATGDGNHVGIDVMHERMATIGARLDLVPGAAGGVCVMAQLPETILP